MSGPYSIYEEVHQDMAAAGAGSQNEISSQESLIYSNYNMGQYNPDELVGKKGLQIYEKMMDDEQIKATTTIKKYSRLSTGWEILPGEAGDKMALMLADYAKTLTRRIQGTFYDVLLEVLSAMQYGFSLSEKVTDIIEKGDFKGKFGYKKIATRAPFGYGFKTDVHGNLEGITFEQAGLFNNNEGSPDNPYPPEKFVVYSYNKEFSNWFGKSDLRAVYRSWFSKNIIIKYYNIYLERYGSPTTYATVGEVSDKKTVLPKLDEILKNLQAKTAFRIPEGIELELLEAQRAGHAGYDKAIELHNTMIARGVLIPELLGFSGRLAGSQALGETQFEIFIYILEKLGRDIEETIVEEQIFRPIIDCNWADVAEDQYPRFKMNTLKPDDVESRSKILKSLKDGGFVGSDEPWVREYLHLPEDERTDEEKKPPVPVPNPIPTPGDPKPEPGKPGDTGDKAKPGDTPEDKNVKKNAQITIERYELSRQPSKYEMKVRFKNFAKKLEESDELLRGQLVDLFTRQRDRLLDTIEKKKIIQKENYSAIDKLELWGVGKIKGTIENDMVKAHLDNKLQALEETERGGVPVSIVNKFEVEVGQATFQPWTPVPPTQAVAQFNKKVIATIITPAIGAKRLLLGDMTELEYYDSRAFAISGVERDVILKEAKLALQTGLKQGQAVGTIMENVRSIYDKYIPSGEKVKGKLLSPARLETMVRTNLSDAVNQGRRAMMDDPLVKNFIPFEMYSAIIDSRTTDYCETMDGRTFRRGSVNVITPPSHYNCRSIMVPVTSIEVERSGGIEVDDITSVPRAKGFEENQE